MQFNFDDLNQSKVIRDVIFIIFDTLIFLIVVHGFPKFDLLKFPQTRSSNSFWVTVYLIVIYL